MLKNFLFLLFITLSIASSPIQAQDDQKKAWNVAQPLQWSDFQGQIDGTSPFIAFTFSGISYTWKMALDNQGTRKFSFTVFSYMDKSKSWLREGRQSDELLVHEQLHFDINEYYARMLLDALQTSTYSNNYRDEIKQVYDQIMKVRQETQDTYDNQTEHSKNKNNQAAWESHMAKLLSVPVKLDNTSTQKAETH